MGSFYFRVAKRRKPMVQYRNGPAVGPSVGLTPTTHTKVGLQRRSRSISECNKRGVYGQAAALV